ncbi:GNAT family protein [Aquirufa lenticrescens]|uniref:GNAT family N-acetyltransferase n=1 Tax=Aquirufa lenticrescens TaxID=2696560 RepID=UPI001CAA6F98|nr:GNAT family N-acetyltransferase [Aquirufa lenticrescens]UAJ14637.1 GNAT family N-acetyltransferase [Aquirufa lenticrescens]
MSTIYTHQLFTKTAELPDNWDQVAQSCIFLQKCYLQILEESSPENMLNTFLGIFEGEKLMATALIQEIDLALLPSFGERDHAIKTALRNILFKQFASKLLLVGNNMLSGQNAYTCLPDADESKVIEKLREVVEFWPKKNHLTIFKDFTESQIQAFQIPAFQTDFPFSSQPNMVFEIKSIWQKEEDYVADLSKKYRDQFKRCRKKGAEISTKELNYEEILQAEETIYDLYLHVAKNAPFNTFILPKKHFSSFKKHLGSEFILRGYYLKNQLVGFTTVIRHGKELETYFLGYDEKIQREKMLYLNMLYDLINCGIIQGFERIILGRTALEIKSSIGAKAVRLKGLMRHRFGMIHTNLSWIFPLLEPATTWIERHPYKD